MRRPICSRESVFIALPAGAAVVSLVLLSIYTFGSAFRPGLFAEFFVVLYLSFVVSSFQRHLPTAALLFSLFLLLFYAACFAKWLALNEAVTLFDFASLDEVLFTLPRFSVVALAFAVLVIGGLFLRNAKRPRLVRAVAVLAPLIVYAAGVFAAPDGMVSAFETVRPEMYWRPDQNMWRNGPAYTLARELPESVRVRRRLRNRSAAAAGGDPTGTIRAAVLPPSRAIPRNLHLILLESFIDPLNFRRIAFRADPIDSRLRRWMRESDSIALSPIFGGQTGRSEFEVLCGLPSYGLLGIEFNILRGAPVPCLPNVLRERGYVTVASVPVPPSFFNVGRAYRGVGFEHRYFGPDFDKSDMDGEWVSNVTVFRHNLARLQSTARAGKPIFNYVVTSSGHEPFALNPATRPPVFEGDTPAMRAATAIHYNSAAAADFVEALEARDPDAVVVLFGDHLPLLGHGDDGFRAGGYRVRDHRSDAPGFWEPDSPTWLESRATPLIVRKARQSVRVGIVSHFVIPEVILDLSSDGAYCQATDCISRRPIIYRPRGAQALFTTREAFPHPVCESALQRGNEPCAAALRLHQTMLADYENLLRAGLGQSKHALAVLAR